MKNEIYSLDVEIDFPNEETLSLEVDVDNLIRNSKINLKKALESYKLGKEYLWEKWDEKKSTMYFNKSKDMFDKFVGSGSKNLDVYITLGDLCSEIGNYKKAIKTYEKGLEIYPDNNFLLKGKNDAIKKMGNS